MTDKSGQQSAVSVQRGQESERDFQRWVTDLLSLRGWRWVHFRTSVGHKGRYQTAQDGAPGFPDIVAVREGRVLFIETKRQDGKTTDDQEAWLAVLAVCAGGGSPVEVYIWKPSDRASAERVLR